MTANIRPALASDAQAIGDLARQFATYLRDLGDPTEFRMTAEAYLRDGFGAAPAFSGLVAEAGGTAIGYLLYHLGYDTDAAARNLHIVDLYVDPSARRRGVGKALMTEAASIAREVGAAEMVWSVYRTNDRAEAFYERLGARRISEVFFMNLKAEAI